MQNYVLTLTLMLARLITMTSTQYNVTLPENCGILRPDQLYNLQKTVEETEYPWRGRLMDPRNEFICHVTLIHKQFVLTAAHCFNFGPREDAYIVELGNCRIRRKCRSLSYLETFVEHPWYTENPFKMLHDIALLRLNAPVTFTEFIQPICLPSPEQRKLNYAAQHLPMTGRQVRLKNRVDMKFQVLVVDFDHCQKLYKSYTINETVICGSTCDNGESYYVGSTLMGIEVRDAHPQRYYLVGIRSSGKFGCDDTTPDLFQSISHHMDWILENMAKFE